MNDQPFIIWQSACRSDRGRVRRINEDAALDLPELGLWVVADGMGGHEAGDVASGMIVKQLQHLSPPGDLDGFISAVRDRLLAVNRSLRDISIQRYSNRTIGSTVAALLAYRTQCAYIWAGDSRIYRQRGEAFVAMTQDHNLAAQYIAQGVLRSNDAVDNRSANVLTRAVGAADELDLDIRIDDLQADDVFLLCSDGLYKELADEEIANHLGSNDCGSMAEELLNTALARGARDNVTVTVVKMKDAFSSPPP